MIDRLSCYDALFKIKDSGLDISEYLEELKNNSGVPRKVIEFLRDNSPQFQFYRYIQKHQKALAEDILDFEEKDDLEKLITCTSFLTRILIAVKYKNLTPALADDLNSEEIVKAISLAFTRSDFSKVNEVLQKHRDNLRLFYLNSK